MVLKKNSGIKKMLRAFASREVIERSSSVLNPRLEVVRIGESLLLDSANSNYSFGGLHRVFRKAFKQVRMTERKPEKVLILGFGAGSVAAILREELGIDCRITAVEKDPEVIRLGRAHFDTARFGGLELICGDASAFVEEGNELFDLIVVDVYVDFEVPASCETEDFVKGLFRLLSPGGMVMFNKLVYNHRASEQADLLEKQFRALKGSTRILRIRENITNRIIVFERAAAQ